MILNAQASEYLHEANYTDTMHLTLGAIKARGSRLDLNDAHFISEGDVVKRRGAGKEPESCATMRVTRIVQIE